MSEETTEEPKVYPRRRCLVLDRIVTNTDHNPGEVIWYDGPDTPNLIRSLTEQELADYEDFNEKAKEEPPPEAGSGEDFQQKARASVINEALHKLNHDDDSSWTESGQPAVSAVSRALISMEVTNTETSRAEIRKYAPTFRRQVEGEGTV